MTSLVDAALAERWCASSATDTSVYRWAWFVPAFSSFAAEALARAGRSGVIDEARVGRAFFEWVSMVEQSEAYARLQPVDHAHFICGRLLRCLLAAQPLRVEAVAQLGNGIQAVAPSLQQQWPECDVLLGFVCTLLQAYRLKLAAGAMDWQEARFQAHWRSFRENVTEDADSAGPFLDFFLGLEPVWDDPRTPAKRPAALQAAP